VNLRCGAVAVAQRHCTWRSGRPQISPSAFNQDLSSYHPIRLEICHSCHAIRFQSRPFVVPSELEISHSCHAIRFQATPATMPSRLEIKRTAAMLSAFKHHCPPSCPACEFHRLLKCHSPLIISPHHVIQCFLSRRFFHPPAFPSRRRESPVAVLPGL
jgi:hypothetical protein